MVYKIPPVGEVNHIWPLAYYISKLSYSGMMSIWWLHVISLWPHNKKDHGDLYFAWFSDFALQFECYVIDVVVVLCSCIIALRHIVGHFGHGQLTYPHCSWASLLCRLPARSAHSVASNWQLPYMNQRKGENGRRNDFMTKLHERMLPDMRIEPATVRKPGGRASDRASAPGMWWMNIIPLDNESVGHTDWPHKVTMTCTSWSSDFSLYLEECFMDERHTSG